MARSCLQYAAMLCVAAMGWPLSAGADENPPAPAEAQAEEIAPPALRRGVNLSNWFADAQRQPLIDRDFQQIKNAGFDHVRIPVDPELLGFSLSEAATGRVLFDFTKLDSAIETANADLLTVILDMAPSDVFTTLIDQEPRVEAGLIALWHSIAEHYRFHPTSNLVFEILNTPNFTTDPDRYAGLIPDIVSAIRESAPMNLVIIDIPRKAEIEGFAGFVPIKDTRTYYAFHFYEPYIITHAGLPVRGYGQAIRYFRNVPYPSSLATPTANVAPTASDPFEAKKELQDYIAANWDARHLAARIKIAADWAHANQARILCTEFGAVRKSNTPAARYQWIADARKAFEANDIGWDLWDYTDLFGITTLTGMTIDDPSGTVRLADPDSGSRDIEPEAIKALFGG